MKKLVFLVSLLLLNQCLSAQFMVQYMHVNPMKFSMNDFNKININNSGSNQEKARVIYLLKDEKNNNICEIDFNIINLNPGSNQLNYSQGKINWSNTPYRDQLLKDQLVMGNFQVCVGVTDLTEVIPNFNDCFDVELKSEDIENPLEVRPLELNTPNDKDTIEEKRPLLTWIPPSPVYQGTMYHLTLTEKKEKQTCIESLNNNVPIIDKKSIQTNILNYPVEVPVLTEGKTYCWRVAAYRNDKEYTRSEEWEFVEQINIEHKKGVPLINNLTGSTLFITDKKLEFGIDNFSNDKILKVKFINNKVKDNLLFIPIVYGYNLINIPIEEFKLNDKQLVICEGINNVAYSFYITKVK